ncbi:MAG: hypothetical protein LBT57_01875 [Puniceicoccales bacterium]|jgi:hypothetical protein|nr:hypothetical protein [Puniceicoccales bacterium]
MPDGLPNFFTATAGLTNLAIELCDILELPRFFTAEGFTDCFQENFLRPSELERYQCSRLPPAAKNMDRGAFYELCRRWGFLEEILPRRALGDYDAILIYALGVEGMCAAGHYLKNQLLLAKEQGATFLPDIFVLTGSRLLTMEGEEAMAEHLRERHLPDTEEWAARLLFRHALQDLEKSFEIVSVPMQQTHDAGGTCVWRRPDTRDTLRAFFSQCGAREQNSLLAISLNPFVSYQHAVGLATWREKGGAAFYPQALETVGPLHPRFMLERWKSDEERLIAILLDNFARCAYEELGLLVKRGAESC